MTDTKDKKEKKVEKKKWKCKKHKVRKHDVFINYRVKSDSNLALNLFLALGGETKSDGKNFRPFLDQRCLVDGEEWESGFLNGLEHAAVILMIISEDGIEGIKTADKHQDNVLLEYEYALEKHEKGTAIMLPLHVGKYIEGGLYKPFGAFGVSDYPDQKHLSPKSTKSVRETMEKLFKIQGLKTDPASFNDKMKDITSKIEEALKQFSRLGEAKEAETYNDRYVSEWTVADVQHWLKDSGLGEHGPKFKSNAIDGTLLLKLNEQLLKGLDVTNSFHVLKITSYIEEQKKDEAAADEEDEDGGEEDEDGDEDEGGEDDEEDGGKKGKKKKKKDDDDEEGGDDGEE